MSQLDLGISTFLPSWETLNQNLSLQQYTETPKQKHAGGYTQMHHIHPITLNEPQGIIKKPALPYQCQWR